MKNFTLIILIACFALLRPAVAFSEEAAPDETVPKIQLAILLDTSNSMDGLIDQAKSQLWEIVNDFIKVKQKGVSPTLEVALYHYGNNDLPARENYIQQLTQFTTDLDLVSEKLFSLKTNGGSEYCGAVIQEAVRNLQWSDRRDDFRLIFIAGNEEFTQGPISYVDACNEAVAKHIIVNTIHCGDEDEGIGGKWQDGAMLTDGVFLVINQDREVRTFDAPQDDELAKLNTELNATYIPYGDEGAAALENQALQDVNNAKTLASRIKTKASNLYRNSKWDLVDASAEEGFDLSKIAAADLPENMQTMTLNERKIYIAYQAETRKKIQAEIAELSKARAEFVAAEMAAYAAACEDEDCFDSFGDVAAPSIRMQLQEADFEFEE